MPQYTPPLRDMHFVLHELLGTVDELKLCSKHAEIDVEDLIEDEEMVVTVSHRGYAKRTSVTEYRAQRRGGKGVAGAALQDDDFVEHLFVTSSLAYLMVFTSKGKVYGLKVYEIPESGRTARGRALVNLLSLAQDESVSAILPVREFREGRSVVMATVQGIIKRVALMDFSRPRKTGIIACCLDEGDALIGAALSKPGDEILLATKNGMAIRFADADCREMGRAARGVRGVRLDEGDRVVGMAVVAGQNSASSEELTLLTVCEQGYGKRTDIGEYRVQGRGGRGLIDIQTEDRNGPVVGVFITTKESQLMLTTSGGQIIRFNASGLSVIGRNTKGVRLIELAQGEKVVAVAQLIEQENGAPVNGSDVPPIDGAIQ